MEDAIIKDLVFCVALHRKELTELQDVYNVKFENIGAFFSAINTALKKCEETIEKEHKKPYITDDYENEVRSFTNCLVDSIFRLNNYIELKKIQEYAALLKQRHMAYSFYHFIYNKTLEDLSEEKNELQRTDLLEAYMIKEHEKDIYSGLVDFYSKFYGRFSDNQEAIVLLCKYYPSQIDDFGETELDKISYTLYVHMSNAGTPRDIGFAYRGIELIEKYVKCLPVQIVKKILESYRVYNVIAESVYRHQIVSIISCSKLEDKEKKKIKFWCIDAILIINSLNKEIIKKVKETATNIDVSFSEFNSVISNNINVLNEPAAFWKNEKWEKWILNVDGDKKGELASGHIQFYNKSINLNFELNDWVVGYDFNKLFLEEKRDQIKFSLLYLNNYRGLKEQTINFDHLFEYNIKEKSITVNKNENIRHFYGKNIYSLTCLVGKNGTGKTSIIDFLRETFFAMLCIIKEKGCVDNGYIKEESYKEYEILDSKSEFMVIFHINKDTYYLTNIIDINNNGIINPLSTVQVININDFGKIAYFSNVLMANQAELYNYDFYKKDTVKDLALKNINVVDFSETKNFIIKNNQMAKIKNEEKGEEKGEKINIDNINMDLYYQIFLLCNWEKDRLKSMFNHNDFFIGTGYEKESIYDASFEQEGSNISQDKIKKYINNPLATIKDFSSGEYFKFIFFSRLYYFLNGKEKKVILPLNLEKTYNEQLTCNCAKNDEEVLIFIDEGEVCYHPEWQRRYISDLLSVIDNKREGKIQIILTTNSPFILSDILGDDVVYLSNNHGARSGISGTLAQNIHKLLTDNFFMEATIGEYARKFINNIAKYISDEEKNDVLKTYIGDKSLDYYKIESLIDLIGEPVYKANLKMLLSESNLSREMTVSRIENRINELDEEKNKLEKELEQLKKGK